MGRPICCLCLGFFLGMRACLGEAAQNRDPGWSWDVHLLDWEKWYCGGALPSQPALGLGPPRIDQGQRDWPEESVRLVGFLPARLDGAHANRFFRCRRLCL